MEHSPGNEFGFLPRLPLPDSLFVLLFYRPLGSQELVFRKLGKAGLGWHQEGSTLIEQPAPCTSPAQPDRCKQGVLALFRSPTDTGKEPWSPRAIPKRERQRTPLILEAFAQLLM